MRAEINFSSYSDSVQAKHTKAWVKEHTAQQKAKPRKCVMKRVLKAIFKQYGLTAK